VKITVISALALGLSAFAAQAQQRDNDQAINQGSSTSTAQPRTPTTDQLDKANRPEDGEAKSREDIPPSSDRDSSATNPSGASSSSSASGAASTPPPDNSSGDSVARPAAPSPTDDQRPIDDHRPTDDNTTPVPKDKSLNK